MVTQLECEKLGKTHLVFVLGYDLGKNLFFSFYLNPHQNLFLSGILRKKLFTPASLFPLWSWQQQSIQRNETAPGKDSHVLTTEDLQSTAFFFLPPTLPPLKYNQWLDGGSASTYLTHNKLQNIIRIATSQNSCMPHWGTCKIRRTEHLVEWYCIYLILRDDRRKAGLFMSSWNLAFQLKEWTKYAEEKPKARKNEKREYYFALNRCIWK